VRTREQFDAERDRSESNGVKLRELLPVEGFGKVERASTPGTTASMSRPAGGSSASRSSVRRLPIPKSSSIEKKAARAALESL
jgi:hypothetical protein